MGKKRVDPDASLLAAAPPEREMEPALDSSDAAECIRCGYSLLGLDPRRPCPECGLLAGFSLLDGRELRHNRPPWLTWLSVGAASTAIGLLAAPAWGIGVTMMRYASQFSWRMARTMGPTDWTAWTVGLALALAQWLTLFAGIWLLTRSPGRQRTDETTRAGRLGLRGLACLPVLPLGGAALAGADALDFGTQRLLDSPVVWFGTALVAGVLVAWLFSHLKGLAARAPAPLLAADSPIVGYTLVGCLAALSVFAWQADEIDPTTDGGMAVLTVLLCIVAVGITAYLWSIYLLVRYAIAFGRSAAQARELMRRFDASTEAAVSGYHSTP